MPGLDDEGHGRLPVSIRLDPLDVRQVTRSWCSRWGLGRHVTDEYRYRALADVAV